MTDREKALIWMDECKGVCYENTECDICPFENKDEVISKCIGRAKDAIRRAIGSPQWISVKDRLPDEGKYVLVWESQGFAYCDEMICGIWNIGANNGAIITHWMPLPEPPKEEDT